MFDLQLDKAIKKIQEVSPKKVLIQLPEGLKPQSEKICKEIETKTGVFCYIWTGSCFGACDIPPVDFDLVIQWGHSEMK